MKKEILKIIWNETQKAPNPIGLFVIFWIASIFPAILWGQTDQSMKTSLHIGIVGTSLAAISFAYIEIKKHIKKKKSK